ncbi:MAG TPA: hypothetical protein VKM72_16355 [Thermoanaerobaculia bacterium]|nr:hypothetical protein [Thermoanaerobaculia bacterium]
MAQRGTTWKTIASTVRALALATLLVGVGACSGDDDSPTSPPPTLTLASFIDPMGGFSTHDVRDSEGEVVRFTVDGSLVWPPTMATFGGFPVAGNLIGPTQDFEIRFGTEGGQRRAYFTERGPGTICDIDLINGMINISPTSQTVPNP